MDTLDDALHKRILKLSARAESLLKAAKYEEAISLYQQALALLPEPVKKWDAATWLYAAIGDAYFESQNFEEALSAFLDAVGSSGGIGNPFIHLRLGEIRYELGDKERAADELARAYMSEGADIFRNEDQKYFSFLATRLKPSISKV